MKRIPFVYKVLIVLGLILLLLFALMLKPVSDKVGEMTGVASDKLRTWAATAAGIVIGVMLVTWGIAAIEIPILGGPMIIAGLSMIGYNVYPLFKSNTTTLSNG